MGYGRPAALPPGPVHLLPQRPRGHHRLRRHQREVFRQPQAVAGGGGGIHGLGMVIKLFRE